MRTIARLRTLARELAGEAWDYERRRLAAQAHVRRNAAKAVMRQADAIQREDAIFEDPPTYDGPDHAACALVCARTDWEDRDGVVRYQRTNNGVGSRGGKSGGSKGRNLGASTARRVA